MLLKYYHTIKHLHPFQLYGRIFSQLKKKFHLYNLPSIPDELKPFLTSKTDFINHDPWDNAENLKRNRFCFLNYTIDMNSKIDWEPDADLLWKFNLHYFNYLYLLSPREQEKICKDWIINNPPCKGTGWHSYPLSLRITNWCKLGLAEKNINKSLYQQAAYLYRNLEFYHPANHYLENARALIFAGLYFKGPGEAAKWLSKGLKIVLNETPKQVLSDGGYFELSIMYHALMLELYLDLLNILPAENSLYGLIENTAMIMLTFLNNLTHPDGNITLFNDSTQEIAPSTEQLNEYSKTLDVSNNDLTNTEIRNIAYNNSSIHPYIHTSIHPCIHAFPDSGYYVYKDEKTYLAIDGSSIGPDNIPAHSHGDIFSYELSFDNEQFIVNTGVFDYNWSDTRKLSKSTSAHNTVCIDKKDQAEFWGSFRVARRLSPGKIKFEQEDDIIIFEGSLDYAPLLKAKIEHQRKIIINEKKNFIKINDIVVGKGDHLIESLIHLHPDVEIIRRDGNDLLVLKKNKKELLLKIEEGTWEIAESWYFPEFGRKIQNKCIIISATTLPCKLEYVIELAKV